MAHTSKDRPMLFCLSASPLSCRHGPGVSLSPRHIGLYPMTATTAMTATTPIHLHCCRASNPVSRQLITVSTTSTEYHPPPSLHGTPLPRHHLPTATPPAASNSCLRCIESALTAHLSQSSAPISSDKPTPFISTWLLGSPNRHQSPGGLGLLGNPTSRSRG